MEKLTIRNLTELRKLSNIIAKLLRPDIYLILEGTLGAGKTELTKMIAKSLGISRNVNSPTFNILQRYHLEEREIFLNHFDFFRLKKDEDISFFKDYCLGNINIIEWPENNPQFWSNEDFIKVRIFVKEKNIRELHVEKSKFSGEGFSLEGNQRGCSR